MNKSGVTFKDAIQICWERGNRYVILNSNLEPITTQNTDIYLLDDYFVYDVFTKIIEHKQHLDLPFT